MHYLIVEQQSPAPENLSELTKELAHKHQLDPYQCRQRLVGQGLSLLAKGPRETLEKISPLLTSAKVIHSVVKPSKPEYAPQRIRNLQITPEQISFDCREKTVIFPKGAHILAIFADLSGTLADKSIQQLLSGNSYFGRNATPRMDRNKVSKTILQGRPVLDLYRLSNRLEITDAVRIFPGKFDPKGLGPKATLSSKQNLLQILNLAEEYATQLHLFHDFGLVNLPGCTLHRDDPDNPETQRHNLISLARYGWLMSDLLQAQKQQPDPQGQSQADLPSVVAMAMAAQNPGLAGEPGQDPIHSLAEELMKDVQPATNEDSAEERQNNKPVGLPAPPQAKPLPAWSKPRFWIGTAGSLTIIAGFMLFNLADNRWLNKAAYHAFASGTIPLMVAAAMFWSAFYFLRLKRQIENTPTSRIRSVAMGMVEVKGRAVRKFALLSPMSHTPCVFYRLTKFRRERNNQWKVSSVSSSANVPFDLEDDTGRIEINPSGCRVSAGTRQEGSSGQVGLIHLSDNVDDKWVEEIIVDGTLLYVLGFAAAKAPSGPSLQAKKTAALRELKRNPQQLKKFDKNGDGVIDADEWDEARAGVETDIMRENLKDRSERKKQQDHIVIGKKKGRPLIIAETHSEDHLTARYLYYSIPLFGAAALATGGAIYLLINYLQT
ncbi:MAG: hypothetical protein JXQ81_00795 [Desulfuromonadales bacterium]|nr:hypothetical protein [Desulfuromonadales bacterium]MBN2791022.1 hypothetical protein [Desulfuromonadales bacterium]